MNGFVANLLSRSRGTADVVRPRLASLFEPGELRARASPMEWQLSSELDGEEALAIDGPATPPAARQELTPARSFPALRDQRAIVVPPDVPGRVGALDPQEASAIPAPARERTALPVNGTGVVARSDRFAGPASALGLSEHSPGGIRRQQDGVSSPRGRTSAQTPDSAGLGPLVERDPGRFDTFHRAPSHPLAAPATEAAHPTLVPAPTPRFRFEPPASRPRAIDPIVEISIGRIEVRAVVERSADRKASTASPVMGLDEYLKARARGVAR
jgi:hypothetical protein